MKQVMTAALALALMAGGAAYAQEHRDEHGGGRPGGGAPHGGGGAPHGPPPGAAPHGPPPGAQHGPGPGGGRFDRGPGPGGPRPGPAAAPRPDAHFDRGPGPGRPGPGPGRPGSGPVGRPGGGPGYHRPGGYLAGHGWNFSQRYRGPAYRYPRGYGYQYWAFGAFLPSVFLSQDYTLYNYWNYGLPPPPNGYHWIRVGPDALLVRYGDGYVLDAAYGLFY